MIVCCSWSRFFNRCIIKHCFYPLFKRSKRRERKGDAQSCFVHHPWSPVFFKLELFFLELELFACCPQACVFLIACFTLNRSTTHKNPHHVIVKWAVVSLFFRDFFFFFTTTAHVLATRGFALCWPLENILDYSTLTLASLFFSAPGTLCIF